MTSRPPQAAARLSARAASIWRRVRRQASGGEQATILNRFLLAGAVFLGVGAQARSGSAFAQEFYHAGLVWLQAYLLAVAAMQAHLLWRPAPSIPRRLLAILLDAAIISYGLWRGDAVAAYIFPLYFWLILGYGVRFGPKSMGAAMGASLIGFGAAAAHSRFWLEHSALSIGLGLSLALIPIYGALLLRRAELARVEAVRANQAKTLLLASVSHELRTPLTAIVGLGDMLMATRLDADQRDMTRTLGEAAAMLMRHIDALLIVSRGEIARARAGDERVDLFALLVSLRALLAVEASKKGVRIGLCIQADTPRHVLAEPGLLLDILQNLAGNAVKFTDSGAVSLHVAALGAKEGGATLRVDVRDTGIGVARSAQARIFEGFVQADSDISRRFGGSGLGLAIARRRLEACGGRIGVESDAGKGALFWFEVEVGVPPSELEEGASQVGEVGARPASPPPRLDDFVNDRAGAQVGSGAQVGEALCLIAPRRLDPLALARRFALVALAREGDPRDYARAQDVAGRLKTLAAASLAGTRAGAEPAQPLTILLAEDNNVNRMVLDKILTRAGHRTHLVADGEAALKAMLNQSFDVVLLDLNMPEIDGVEAARLYHFATPPDARAPILALTADASPQRRDDCARAGMCGCLTKPIAAAALLDAVAGAARSAARRRDGAGEEVRTQAQGAPAGGPLDLAALDKLSALGGEAFLRELILEFVAEGGRIVERMIVAVQQGDQAAFQHEAHALSSSAGNLGASGLAALCRSWRGLPPGDIARRGDEYLADLRREWSLAGLALANILASRAAQRPRRRRGKQLRGDAAA